MGKVKKKVAISKKEEEQAQKSYIYITENTNALQNKEFATNYAD